MTSKEFEAYLHSIGGLINGWRNDDTPIMERNFFSFSDGWLQLTRDLIEDLIALGWDKHIMQAKEKFGTGRFYVGNSTKEMDERIYQWMKQTAQTCEKCGATENVKRRLGGAWILTLCDTCATNT